MNGIETNPPGPGTSDFFRTHSGRATPLSARSAASWWALDIGHDIALRASTTFRRLRAEAAEQRRRQVLIVGIEVPKRAPAIHDVMTKLQMRTRHQVSTSVVAMGDKGKFQNIDAAIARAAPLSAFDWLVVTDDDIAFQPGFLDDLIVLAEASGLSLLQPAHAFRSHASYRITRRHWGSLVRQTQFVEIGPLTLIKADAFEHLVPFPDSRWCYGIDLVWSEVLRRYGQRIGIVDGTPVRHLRPVAGSYNIDDAIAEGESLLRRFGVTRSRADFLSEERIIIGTRSRH